MIERRKTRTVMKGRVPVGGDHPVSVQTMTKVDTADVEAHAALVEPGEQVLLLVELVLDLGKHL